jgi:hypothetical protein
MYDLPASRLQVGFKPEVRLGVLALSRPEFIDGIWRFRSVAPELYEDVMIVTSAQDGEHLHALHGLALAADIRYVGDRPGGIDCEAAIRMAEKKEIAVPSLARSLQEFVATQWCDLGRLALGPTWDVVLETTKNHIHVEWHPKR